MTRSTDPTCRYHDELGLTLFELLVVLAIVALLATVIAPKVVGYLGVPSRMSRSLNSRASQPALSCSHTTWDTIRPLKKASPRSSRLRQAQQAGTARISKTRQV